MPLRTPPAGVAPGTAPGGSLPEPQPPSGGSTPRLGGTRPLGEIKELLGLFGIGIPDKHGEGGLLSQRPDINTGLVQGPTPLINTGPIISPDLLQQQINQTRAGMAASTAGAQQNLANSMAARGMDMSPALLAMQAQLGSRDLASQWGAENQLRLGAAERNAQQQLAAQTALAEANERAFAGRQGEQIERQRIAMSPFQGLFGSILQSVLSGGLG